MLSRANEVREEEAVNMAMAKGDGDEVFVGLARSGFEA